MLAWEAGKDALSSATGLGHPALHVIAGALLAPLAAWVLRRPLSSWWPFLAVLGAELVNESFDATRYLRAGWPWQGWQTLGQVGLTMIVPALLLAWARRRRAPPTESHPET